MSAQKQWPQEKRLWQKYNNANSPELQVENLTHLSYYYYQVLGDFSVVDTLTDVSLDISKRSQNRELILKSYDAFFLYKLRGSTLDLANQYLQELYAIGSEGEWHYRLYQSMTYFQEHNFKAGAHAAVFSIDLAKTREQKIRSLLLAGTNSDRAMNKIESLEYFLKAQDMLDLLSNNALKIKVYSSIQQLYAYNENNERAQFYCTRLIQTINESESIDTAIWLDAKYRNLVLQADSSINDEEIEKEALKTLEFSKQHGYINSYKSYWSFFRSKYISENKIEKLYDLFINVYPEEFKKLKEADTEKFYRINAYFSEYQGNIDSAKFYWELAIEYAQDTADLYTKAHLTRRYAEFLLRINEIDKAYTIGQEALNLSRQSKWDDFIIKSLGLLIIIEENRGNYKAANLLLKEEDSLKIAGIEKSKESNLAVLSIKNEYSQLELKRKNEIEQERFRTKVNYIALISGLFILIIVSYIIFRQYRQTSIEKGKSDKLLLNILPKQTAEELKTKGTTTARRFNNVTVLFCDIVGFTKVAEQLSPEDLVKEIDTYFRVFDDIIQMYGLEKIKTVGDAYVAVGGMPQDNNASAIDVTLTAIKIMEAIERMKRERQEKNMPAFDLRIGINTGSVVAGVVGSIKFQYDIWGDAVNIAARMEQNSEPGRINVSRNTYLEIKSSFNCSYRGKVLAKNKGEIEMYFVETA